MPESPQLSEEQRKLLEEKIKNMSPEELKEFQKQQCIFCQIITGKIPSKKVYDDDLCQAILDVNPAAKGHLLLLPKEHYAIMPQIPEKVIGYLFTVSKNLSQIMLKVLKVSGTNIFIANGPAAGQRAQHFLIHIIPRLESDGVFPVPEKLIDKAMQQKVKMAVEEKLLALLGKKKTPQEKQPQQLTMMPEIIHTEKEQKSEGQKQQGRKKGTKEKVQKSHEKNTHSPQRKELKNKIDLDDIAALFK